MKHILLLLLLSLTGFAQMPSSQLLSKEEIQQKFTPAVSQKLGITFRISKAYRCLDKSGTAYLVLTESEDSLSEKKDTLSSTIKAFYFSEKNNVMMKLWEINDFRTKSNPTESSIWFWSKYIELSDLDNDGLLDAIIVYGTHGANGFDDGRIKILVYYKGMKYAIRHQNGVLDFERNTQVDQAYYTLPSSIQGSVKALMQKMTENNVAIFPAGWEEGMKAKKTILKE